MVLTYVKQGIKQVLKSRAKQYITQEYGAIAGGIAGIAISAGTGDYYGAVRDIGDYFRGGKPDNRNPTFGYYDKGEDQLDGTASGPLSETLRTVQPFYRGNRRGSKRKYCKGCRRYNCKSCRRGRGRNNC